MHAGSSRPIRLTGRCFLAARALGTPLGAYLLVRIVARNTDTAPHGLERRMFSVRDKQGRQYMLNCMSDRRLFARDLQPGGSAAGMLLFGLPADARDCVLTIRAGKEGTALASTEIPCIETP